MTAQAAAMHVARIRSSHTDKQGRRREYESRYLRRTYRDGGKVRHETLANLSGLPEATVDLIEAALKGTPLVPARQAVTITAALPHGHVAAVYAMSGKLGLPALLGPACRERDLALALITAWVVAPASKLSTLTWWSDTTLGADLGAVTTDQLYAAMDWLVARQDQIENKLAARHLGPEANPSRMALFDLSSSWLEGSRCPLAARGYSRNGKKGKLQVEYGLLTDLEGRPVAVRVFPGDAGDPTAFTEIAGGIRDKFELAKMVMVGDRGMITSARIQALNAAEDGTELPGACGWITALRARAIKKLMADDGPLQRSLFDEQSLTEITSPDYPGERLVACRNPVLAVTRNQAQIDADAALDGFYVLRTPIPAAELDAPGVVIAYKNLKCVEQDFRHIKADDLDLRPIWHRLEDRVKAHVLICMLGCYLAWHLRRAWAPLTFTDQNPPVPADPVLPASQSTRAAANACRQHDETGRPYRSFRGLLAHLGTLTRNQVRFAGTRATVPMLAEPTSTQRQAFDLIGALIPLTLR